MAITNTTKPSDSIVNTDKVSFAETWGHITTTWATETRTWAGCASLFTNPVKPSNTMTNIAKP
jgi:expansin (peptidoglycan-binding protein)